MCPGKLIRHQVKDECRLLQSQPVGRVPGNVFQGKVGVEGKFDDSFLQGKRG